MAAMALNFVLKMTVHSKAFIGYIVELVIICISQKTAYNRVLEAGAPCFWDMNKQIFIGEKHSTSLIYADFYNWF